MLSNFYETSWKIMSEERKEVLLVCRDWNKLKRPFLVFKFLKGKKFNILTHLEQQK